MKRRDRLCVLIKGVWELWCTNCGGRMFLLTLLHSQVRSASRSRSAVSFQTRREHADGCNTTFLLFFFLWENELIFLLPGRKCIISELKCAKWHLQKTVEF